MAIGDLTAEQQVLLALATAQEVLLKQHTTRAERDTALSEISEALKRIAEARAQ